MRQRLYAVAMAAVATLSPALLNAGEQEDKVIAQKIATALRDSGQMKGYSIGVKFKEGTAWVAGRVTSKEQAASALQVVSSVEGVDQIVNNLTIGAAPTTPISSGRKVKPAMPSAEPQQAEMAQGQISLATAQQPMPHQQIANAGGYQQLPPAQLQQNGVAQPMPGYNRPLPAYQPGMPGAAARATYDQAHMPNYAWPSYAAYPNYAALTYPKQYSASAWPFIGPFYPYPQVPLGWRRVSLEWDDGWWFLDFDDRGCQ
jgi:hypothetical protein